MNRTVCLILCVIFGFSVSCKKSHERIPIIIQSASEEDSAATSVLNALELFADAKVAEVGVGSEMAFAQSVGFLVGPKGLFYAEDVKAEALAIYKTQVEELKLANVRVILGTDSDIALPERVDAILSMSSFHEWTKPKEMLQSIKRHLVPGGRFVLVDMENEAGKSAPLKRDPTVHALGRKTALAELSEAGFRIGINKMITDSKWMIQGFN